MVSEERVIDAEKSDKILANPFPTRSKDSIWSRANKERDRLYKAMENLLEKRGIEALVHRSVDFEIPAWIELRAWIPKGRQATERVSLRIEIHVCPHQSYEFEFTISSDRPPKKRRYNRLIDITEADVQNWGNFALDGGRKPSLAGKKLRRLGFDIWRQKNRVPALTRWDPVNFGLIPCILLAMIGFSVPGAVMLGVVGIAGFAGVGWFSARRKRFVVNAGKPGSEPHLRGLVDSWHTTLLGAGDRESEARERILKELSSQSLKDFLVRQEATEYVGVDGKQCRQQIMLYFGRGQLACYVYGYADDLFIGWTAYANFGEWEEFKVAGGYHRALSRPVEICSVRPSAYSFTDFDIIDIDFLVEWTHAHVTKAVKRLMDELNIDQEIDFQIVRGERQGLVDSQRTGQKDRQRKAGGLGRMRGRRLTRTA